MSIDLPPCRTYKQIRSGLPWDNYDYILTCIGFTINRCHENTPYVASQEGLSLAQVMTRHKSYVKEQAQQNELVTCDTFALPSNVRKPAKNKADKLWQKIQRT